MNRLIHAISHSLRYITLAAASLILVSCITEGGETPEQTTLVSTGQTAPDFTTEMLDGSSVTLSDLRGHIVLLTFWSSQCPMCRAEMAVVQQRIIDRFAGEEFDYLPVSRGESREDIEMFCEDNGYTFPIGLDPDRSIYNMYATKFVPRSFVIDRNGVIRHIPVEYELGHLDEIAQQVERLLHW